MRLVINVETGNNCCIKWNGLSNSSGLTILGVFSTKIEKKLNQGDQDIHQTYQDN